MLEYIMDYYPEEVFLKADGFDSAIIGVDEVSMRLIYSERLCLEELIVRDGMSMEEAIEYFDFNVRGSYVGEKTPIWCVDTMMG